MACRIFVADLGVQAISLAEFQVISGSGLVLHSLTQEKLTSPFLLHEFSQEQITILRAWRKKEKIKEGEKLTVSLPSQFVLTRFLKLPETQDVRTIIAFEAQQNIPFPLSQVVWNYQIINSLGKEGGEVLLVAAKKAPLIALRKKIREAGFLVERMESASTALYNALRFNYAEVRGCSLLIDIGSFSTNLIFWEEINFFIRTIPFGGGMSTSANEHGANKGRIELVERVRNPTIKKMVAEIDRSIAFYCNHQGGNPPDQIFLCGYAGATLREIFNEKFQKQVDFFDPLRNVKIPSKQVVKVPVDTLGEIVGLATQALKKVPIKINLLEAFCDATRRKPTLIVATICFILALFNSGIYLLQITSLKTTALKNSNFQLSLLAAHTRQLNKQQNEQLIPVIKAIEERAIWPNLIKTLEESLPSKFIWVTRLEPTIGNKTILSPPSELRKAAAPVSLQEKPADHLLVEGLYLENPQQASVVDDFVHNLSQSSCFVIPDKAKAIRVREAPDGEHWAYGYTLMLPLRLSSK